jgi:hypothetical protein
LKPKGTKFFSIFFILVDFLFLGSPNGGQKIPYQGVHIPPDLRQFYHHEHHRYRTLRRASGDDCLLGQLEIWGVGKTPVGSHSHHFLLLFRGGRDLPFHQQLDSPEELPHRENRRRAEDEKRAGHIRSGYPGDHYRAPVPRGAFHLSSGFERCSEKILDRQQRI